MPVDLHLFSAPIGTAASGYAEFLTTMQSLLPPPNHVLDPVVGLLPGSAHPGPYDAEMGQGVANAGFVDRSVYSARDFSRGNGVFLAYMVVRVQTAPPAPRTTTPLVRRYPTPSNRFTPTIPFH